MKITTRSFATRSQTFEVEISAVPSDNRAQVTLRNSRTRQVLNEGWFYVLFERGVWQWCGIPKSITIPPGLVSYAQEETEKVLRNRV